MITVVIADDQGIVRSGLRAILESEPDIEVVGEAQDGLDAVGIVARRHPDVVLMDIRMPRMDGLLATREIVRESAGVGVIVITTFAEDEYVFGALQAGASGFLLKDAPAPRILEAVRVVARGEGLLAPEVTQRLIRRFAEIQPSRAGDPILAELTPRERDVLLRIAAGKTNAEIADDLVLEITTVKGHVGRLLAKLGLTSRVQAVVFAYETGMVLPSAHGPEPAAT